MIDDLVQHLSAADMQQLLTYLANNQLRVNRKNIKHWMRKHDFEGREMLFPKRWITIGVLPAETMVKV